MPYLKDGRQVLFLLHRSPPHSFDKRAGLEIQQKLKGFLPQVRVRFFGEGKGPIYSNQNNPLGILGDDDLADSYDIQSPIRGYDLIPTDLIVNQQKKLINPKHYNFIWSCYWHMLWSVLNSLQEDIQWLCMFELRADEDEGVKELPTALKTKWDLWHKLAQFANLADELQMDEITSNENLEFNYKNFWEVLNNDHKEAAKRIKAISEYVGKVLKGKLEDEKTGVYHLRRIQEELVEILKILPEEMV